MVVLLVFMYKTVVFGQEMADQYILFQNIHVSFSPNLFSEVWYVEMEE